MVRMDPLRAHSDHAPLTPAGMLPIRSSVSQLLSGFLEYLRVEEQQFPESDRTQ